MAVIVDIADAVVATLNAAGAEPARSRPSGTTCRSST